MDELDFIEYSYGKQIFKKNFIWKDTVGKKKKKNYFGDFVTF